MSRVILPGSQNLQYLLQDEDSILTIICQIIKTGISELVLVEEVNHSNLENYFQLFYLTKKPL